MARFFYLCLACLCLNILIGQPFKIYNPVATSNHLYKPDGHSLSATTSSFILEINFNYLRFFWNFNNEIFESYSQIKKKDSTVRYLRFIRQPFDNEFNNKGKEHLQALISKQLVENLEIENKRLQKSQQVLAWCLLGSIAVIFFTLFLTNYLQKKQITQKNAFELKEKVYAIISHDLKSPLLALQDLYGQANFLIKVGNTAELKELTNNIDKTSNNISNLLSNLLYWATNANKNIHKIKSVVNLHNQVNTSVALYANTLKGENIVLVNKINTGIEISANSNVLDLIIRNWLDNVLKYSHASCIEIYNSESNKENNFCLHIVDNGIVSQNKLEFMKDLIDNTQSNLKINSTTGLGLSFILHFANEAGWKLDLERVGNKTVFTILMQDCLHNKM